MLNEIIVTIAEHYKNPEVTARVRQNATENYNKIMGLGYTEADIDFLDDVEMTLNMSDGTIHQL